MVIRTGFVNVNSKEVLLGSGVHAVPGIDAVRAGASLNRQLVSPVPVWAR